MNQRWFAVMMVALWVGSVGLVAAKSAPAESKEKPGVYEAAVVSLTATVKSIDYKTRMMTLQNAEGQSVSMEVGPDAVRFAEIKKGDVVEIDYIESVGLITVYVVHNITGIMLGSYLCWLCPLFLSSTPCLDIT
jgi:Cu/Ag efflux protein CusF